MSNIQTQLNLSAPPIAHYRVEDVGVEVDQQIHTWPDVSGQSNHLSSTANNTRSVSAVTNTGPTLRQTQYVGVGNIERSVFFDMDKMYCELSNPITSDLVDVYVVCRMPEFWTHGHMMGLESSTGGDGFSFGRVVNLSNNFQVHDGVSSCVVPYTRPQFSLYRMSIDSTMLSVDNVLSDAQSTANRSTILDLQTTPFDILTLGAGVWSSNDINLCIDGIEIVEVIMFNDILNNVSHEAVADHLINKHDMRNKYLAPTSGTCVFLDGEPGTHMEIEDSDIGPNISTQRSKTSSSYQTPELTASMYELWFYPVYMERDDDHPRYEMLFNLDGAHMVYLDRAYRNGTNSELKIRNYNLWWLNTGHQYRVYDCWNRLCMLTDVETDNMKVFLNSEMILDYNHVYHHYSRFDQHQSRIIVGNNESTSLDLSDYGSFRGKLLGVRKIRDDYQSLIELARSRVRFDQLDINTSTTVTPPEKIGMAPVYRNTFNMSKLPDLAGGKLKLRDHPIHTYPPCHLGNGFNMYNPDFTGLESNINCNNRIQTSGGRFKNLSAFVDILGAESAFNHNSQMLLTHGRLETLSHLRGSNFNERGNWYVFDVSHNRLTDIDGLQDLKKASYLRLNDNNISDITAFTEMEPDALQGTIELNLRNNNITSLPAGVFDKFDSTLKRIYLSGNPLTTIDNLSSTPGMHNLDCSGSHYTGNESIADLSNCTQLQYLTMNYTPNITALPDLTQTDLLQLQAINNPDLTDISSLADAIKPTTTTQYSTMVSETDAILHQLIITNNPSLSETPLINRFNAGGRITVNGNLTLSNNPQINDLRIFQNSLQDDTYTQKQHHAYARAAFENTGVTDTANSLGIMRNFKYGNRVYLNSCDTPTLHQHAFPSNPTLTRDEAYNVLFGRYFYLTYNSINDLSFLLNPQAAGIQYLYMDRCPNVSYESFAAIKDQLINLKQTTNMRLIYIGMSYTDWDNKQYVGDLGPICVNGTRSPQLQLKKDLWDVGIRLSFRAVSTSYPESLGNSSQLPAC